MHQTAYEVTKVFADTKLPKTPLAIAEIGSADVNGSVRSLFERPGWTYRGFDMAPGRNVDEVLPSLYSWPNINDAAFDVVITISTMEHVPKPWVWIHEVSRILKPGGIVYLHAPNTWPFHEYPVDCWRIWPDGLRALFDEAGIECERAVQFGQDTYGWGVKR